MFFIFDCTGAVVGNPKGYATFRGASQQAESRYSKVNRAIWQTFEATQANLDAQGYPKQGRLIYEVKKV